METNCYNYKLKTFEKGIFDRSADATYIIHLEGNGRYDSVMQQLEKYHPTKLVYIAFNKGYKKCKKNLKQDLAKYDLIDAFLNVFKHARKEGYANILVLEDDFIFSELVLDPVVSSRVNTFIKDQGDTSFIYLLGSLPLIQIPYDNYNSIAYATGGTHSVIYSKKFIEKTLKRDKNTIDDWDIDSHKTTRYTYYKPLCYQIFSLTENRKSWFESSLLLLVIDTVFTFFRLDQSVEPGYTIFNIVSKLLFFFSLILITYLVWYLAQKLGLSSK